MAVEAEYVKALFSDPVAFSQGVLGHRLWSGQKAMLRAFHEHPLVAVKGCNGCGKAYTAADFACWWINHDPQAVAIITGPTWAQISRVMWGYLQGNAARWAVPNWTINQTEIRISESNYALGLSTNSAEAFSGWHGKVLIIIDEAPGFPAWAWDAIFGIMAAGDVHVIALGNPTIPGGQFYEAFTRDAARWKTITIDAFDTPNLRGLTPQSLLRLSDAELERNPWPEITKRKWVKEQIEKYGIDSPFVQARVLGKFPGQASDALYPLSWLEPAQQIAADPGGPVIAGLDIAGGGGDETALTLRCGDVILETLAWPEPDPRGDLIQALDRYAERLQAVFADHNGIGYYLVAVLRDRYGEHRVFGVSAADATAYPERFVNYKAELYWAFRERLQLSGVRNWTDLEAYAQASAVRYKLDGVGRIQIESKADAKKRGLSSPDRLESLLMAFIKPEALTASAGVKIGQSRGLGRATAW